MRPLAKMCNDDLSNVNSFSPTLNELLLDLTRASCFPHPFWKAELVGKRDRHRTGWGCYPMPRPIVANDIPIKVAK